MLEWAQDRDPARGLGLASSFESYWIVRDAVEGAAWLERLLARAPEADPELRANALRALGGASDILGENERAAPCYRESLELFAAAGSDVEAAHIRFRIAANMVMRGEKDAAWPLLEDALLEARELDHQIGEAQALGFLVQRSYADGDLEQAIALALESARLAREAGWTWWEAGQLGAAATIERERGGLDAAERHAIDALELSVELGDRRSTIFAAAELAIIAAERGASSRSGLLWGALESEASSGRVGQWEQHRSDLEALALRADGPEFAASRSEGSLLSIPKAAGLEPV
ncbi:MAG: hypothetical protein LH654_05445 [Thermoleophilia bacterium]|nr:hypothetical protein [Thermoleophilia bacterium]